MAAYRKFRREAIAALLIIGVMFLVAYSPILAALLMRVVL